MRPKFNLEAHEKEREETKRFIENRLRKRAIIMIKDQIKFYNIQKGELYGEIIDI